MKNIIWLLGMVVLAGCVQSGSDIGSARVLRVIDGDTVVTTEGIVRLLGIDAPEKGECGHEEATEKLIELVDGKDVNLVPDFLNQDLDKYGRLLRYIEISGTDVAEVLLKEGYSDVYPWFSFERLERYQSVFIVNNDRCSFHPTK